MTDPPSDVHAVELRISGRVQGVGFRYATRRAAAELGIAGTVRNEEDGTVHVHAEGPVDKLEEFVRWCSRGPSLARVDGVARCEVDVRGDGPLAIA